jgi:MFS family permease
VTPPLYHGWTVGAGAFVILSRPTGSSTAIVRDFFGHAHAGSLVGFLFMLAGSMAAWGPLGAGVLHDATGTYRTAFLLAAAFNLLAVTLLAACRPMRQRGGRDGPPLTPPCA